MNQHAIEQRSVLQRRNSLSNTLQTLLDGASVIAITCALVQYHIGSLTPDYVIMLLLLMGILAVVYDQFGVYRYNTNFTTKAMTLFKAWTASFCLLVAIAFLSKESEAYSRELVAELYLLGFVTQAAFHLAQRVIHRRMIRSSSHHENVLIVGHGQLANYLYQKISSNPWLNQQVVGSLLLQEEERTVSSGASGRQLAILGLLSDLPQVLETYEVDTVYIVIPLNASSALEQVYFSLLDQHVTVHWVPDIFSLRLVNHSVREIAGVPVLTLSETPLIGTRYLMKNLEDMVLSSLILILISPLLVLIAIAVKLDSPGPVFFRQRRAGWNGKIFNIWKFRSMVMHQAEGDSLKQAERNDPRVTRVGAFLRRTSLDELPQIFNVLAGDMSLVGPRPHAIQHDQEYSRRIAAYFARHNIKPGITGLAQVRGYRGETREIEQMVQRVESDIEYINNWSIWLDLSILMRTALALTGEKAY